LNLTGGQRLAWQERKADSFVFTPRFCGYAVKPDVKPRVKGRAIKLEKFAYRPTSEYLYPPVNTEIGGPFLGTAMAISGAAASPNMGYHSSPALAFLMTVFDVRLDWWAGNPRSKRTRMHRDPPWKRRGPRLGILYLLLELFGSADDERGYVDLSDGGHFENLGIYELVRRGSRLIVACDASADGKCHFEDLGNAIRKCRIDLGIDISISVEQVRPELSGIDAPQWCKSHYALGVIHYEKLDSKNKPGVLVYIKSSMCGKEPADVLQYKTHDAAFPHDTTADQFFTESEFESYRALGQHIVDTCDENGILELIRRSDAAHSWDRLLEPQQLEEYLKELSEKKPGTGCAGRARGLC
jgi:hypothetical protein